MGVCKIEDEDMMDENRLDLGGALIFEYVVFEHTTLCLWLA